MSTETWGIKSAGLQFIVFLFVDFYIDLILLFYLIATGQKCPVLLVCHEENNGFIENYVVTLL